MKLIGKYILILLGLLVFTNNINAQINDICAETGNLPSLDSPFAHVPYVFGKVNLIGFDNAEKFPHITISLAQGQQVTSKWTIEKSGNYCFKMKTSGGMLIVHINGLEVARRTLPTFTQPQQREDFEIAVQNQKNVPPSVLSAKFAYPQNPKTIEIYKKAAKEIEEKNLPIAINYLKEIVEIDANDFIAWAKLGSLYMEKEMYKEADIAFRKSLELKIEYTPAWLNVGIMRMQQKKFEAAIQIFNHITITLKPKFARAYQLLGESYLQIKQGTLGAEALNKALELDPNGMAECHLLLGHLYELAKANKLATKEYKAFLNKVPVHKDKKKLEEFIKKNPE